MQKPKPTPLKAGLVAACLLAAIAVAVLAATLLAQGRQADKPVLASGTGEVIPGNAFKVAPSGPAPSNGGTPWPG